MSTAGHQKRTELVQDVRNGNVERAKYGEKLQEITEETETKIIDVLTNEQKAQFEKMKGVKFELPQRRFQFQAVPIQPGQLKKIQIQPQQIQRNGNKIQIQAAPTK